MPSAQTSLAALLLLLALVSEASAKMETKKWDREPLTDGPTYRTDMCAISQKVIDGEVKLRDALIGLNISLIIRDYPLFFNINENGTINDGGYPGLIPRLLDDVAGRGGFRWRNSWGMMKHPAPKSWTEMLVWGVEHYDIWCHPLWR
ncbi:hypothetical protein T484DRAFT_1922252 [Baffinella frigidus]|nr:hypothetical protein T484DRAFT_1922252 [Cryptophyta sp. CCMP2293]